MTKVLVSTPQEFEAVKDTLNVPETVGVPDIVFVVVEYERPAGRVDVATENDAVFEPIIVYVNVSPTFPDLVSGDVIFGRVHWGAGSMVITRVLASIPQIFEAEIPTLNVPAIVGLPKIVFVVVEYERPAGRVDVASEKIIGVVVAGVVVPVIVKINTSPTFPITEKGDVIWGNSHTGGVVICPQGISIGPKPKS